ncbi:MAG: DUF4918 family protein [Bacteroidetes bacterium]|nr:DUF4918 family protein [Bacteroidota bacterium]
MPFSEKVLAFFRRLDFPVSLPPGIEVMHPFRDKTAMSICAKFYRKYYGDENRRQMIVGINPGRFGGGITGVPFTDPIRLKKVCGIDNPWPQKQELSSVFIYEMIDAYGGPEAFYHRFFITSISPLGFTKGNKNLNYYDDKTLQESIRPFVLDCFAKEFRFGVDREVAFCLGDGKNFRYFSKLNKEEKLFGAIVPLSHPRFIMQYRVKKKQEYIDNYLMQFHDHPLN